MHWRKLPFWAQAAAAAAASSVLLLLLATAALKIFLPPERLKTLIVSNAEKSLKREVRLKGISVGALKGLVIEGLEISEVEGFKRGRFAAVDSFQLKIQLMPLLSRKVVVNSLAASGLEVMISKDKDGTYNFSDLMKASTPEAKDAKPAAPAPLPFDLDVAKASLSKSRVSYRDAGSGQSWNVTGIEAKAADVSLDKPFPVTLSLSASQNGAGGLQAKLSYSGELDLSGQAKRRLAATAAPLALDALGFKIRITGKALQEGESLSASVSKASIDGPGLNASLSAEASMQGERISAKIKSFEADASGLKLSGTLSARADGRSAEITDIKGRVGDGELTASVGIRDYAKAPSLTLDATLSSLDGGKLLAAKNGLIPPTEPAKTPAAAPSAKPAPGAAGPAAKAKGSLKIGRIVYGKMEAKSLVARWDLSGITPDLRGLSGWAKFAMGGGSFQNDDKPGGERSRLLKALMLPLKILKPIGKLGSALKILPDFENILFSEIVGDYAFERGIMSFRDFHMNSAAANVKTVGSIDLPEQKLNLVVHVSVARLAPLDVDVTGTFEDPKTRLRLDKTLIKPVEKLAQPAVDLIKGLFKKK